MRRVRTLLALCLAAMVLAAMGSATAQASHGVTAWGSNPFGELGNETFTKTTVPTTVSNLSNVTAIANGWQSSFALLESGTIMQWGGFVNTPTAVTGISGATAIAAGDGWSMALLSNGTVKAWGSNESGQLGDGTTTSKSEPVTVSGLSGVVAIAAGASTGLALLENGTVKAWGDNEYGELGNGTNTGPDKCSFEGEKEGETIEYGCSTEPLTVSGVSEVTAIAGGLGHSLALLGSGKVLAWGENKDGELGDETTSGPEKCAFNGTETACSTTPVEVSGLSGVTKIAAPGQYSLALLESKTVKSWGLNTHGQLGDGTTTTRDAPVTVSWLTEVTAIGGGEDPGFEVHKEVIGPGQGHSLAVLSNGTVEAWGANSEGQLGIGTVKEQHAPTPISGFEGVVAVSGGNLFSMAMGEPGPVVTGVSPSSGTLKGGTEVTVSGSHFTGATTVEFGSVPATITSVTSTSIKVTTAPGTRPSEVHVTVTTLHGRSTTAGSANKFDYFAEGLPEFGRCFKVGKGEGKYKNGSCTSPMVGGNNEWNAGVTSAKFTLADAEATTFETAAKTKIVCSTTSGSGEYDGTKGVKGVTLSFHGCEGLSAKCTTSGQAEGVIRTHTLEGVVGWESKELDNAGLDLFPTEEASEVLSFSCGSTPVTIRGSVIGQVTSVNTMTSTFKLKYKQSKSLQKPEALEGGSPDVLQASIGEEAFEAVGLASTQTLSSEEEVELNTAL